MSRRRALLAHRAQIPDEYVFYDYIEYISGSYLDTLYIPTDSPKIVTRIQIVSDIDADIFGFNQKVFPSFIVDPARRGSMWYNRWGNTAYASFSKRIMSIADCTFGQYTVIDGVPQPAFPDVNWSTNNQSILVGAGRNSNCDIQVYSFQLYDGDALVRDMVACMRLQDSAIGMYDNVTKLFYQSAGTVTPILGNINQ